MSTNRDSFGCGVVGSALYAVGGESANYPFALNSVERLDLTGSGHRTPGARSAANATWELVASMHDTRTGHAVAVLGGKIFAAGGMAGDTQATFLASVEAYELRIGKRCRLGPETWRCRVSERVANDAGALNGAGIIMM